MGGEPIDELSIQIDASADSANSAIDNLVDKLTKLSNALGGTKSIDISSLDKVTKKIEQSMKPSEELADKYKDLGKGFEFHGDMSGLTKQLDSLETSLEKAKLKKEELELAGNDSGKMYEYAIRDVQKYSNMVDGLRAKIEEISATQVKPNLQIHDFNAPAERTLDDFRRQLATFDDDINKTLASGGTEFNVRGIEMALESLREKFPQAEAVIESYEEELKRARELELPKPKSQEYNVEIKNAPTAKEKLQGLGEKLERLEVPEIREERLDKLNSAITRTENKLDELRTKLSNGLEMGTVTESADDSKYVRLQEQIKLTEKRLESLKAKIQEVEENGSGSGGGLSKFRGLLQKIGGAAKTVAGKLGSVAKGIANMSKHTKSSNHTFSKGIKNVLKYAFGIRGLFTAFNKLRNGIKEGMKNLVQFDSTANKNVSLLTNTMTQMKNASAAMLSPLLDMLAPAINTVGQAIINVMNKVNQLTSALSGKTTWIKAKALTDDYAKSLDNASKSAKGSARAFDELKAISIGGNESDTTTNAKNMFETVEVDSNVMDLPSKLKDMWANADFSDLGEAVSKKIKGALERIDWPSIKKTCENIGKSVATFINGAVEGESAGITVGTTIGEAINTGISSIKNFIDNTSFSEIGLTLSNAFDGMIAGIDFWEAGRGLGEGINGILDIAIAFLEETDWQELGDKCAEFIAGIDWSGIAVRLFEGIGAALGGLASFVWGFIEDAWNEVVDWWYDTAYEDGQFTMEGLLDGICEGVKNIGTWIDEHIFKPFVDGFKKAFKIHSPSKVMEEQGNFITEGLLNGVKKKIQDVIDVFTKLKDKISKKWDEFKKWWKDHSTLPSIKLPGSEDVEKTLQGIKNVFRRAMNEIIGFAERFSNGVINSINGIIRSLNGVTNAVGKVIGIDLNIPELRTIHIQRLETGGFVEPNLPNKYSLLMAGEHGKAEMLGTVGGRTAVAGGVEITGIKDEIRATSNEEMALLRQQNSLLQAILEKEFGISKNDIGKAAQSWARDYTKRTGQEAYSF